MGPRIEGYEKTVFGALGKLKLVRVGRSHELGREQSGIAPLTPLSS